MSTGLLVRLPDTLFPGAFPVAPQKKVNFLDIDLIYEKDKLNKGLERTVPCDFVVMEPSEGEI
jgi:hypothetical protein